MRLLTVLGMALLCAGLALEAGAEDSPGGAPAAKRAQPAATDNSAASSDAATSSWTKIAVPAEARAFWSFQPLRKVSPPPVGDNSWCRTPIDRFVLARLEAEGLSPNPPLARRRLVRRVYFDLIGLPPSPEEVEAFAADTSPDSYERLIDRLLASPHYGERWGRHWLDLARFAESHGFEHDYDRPTAYHYRDFVIDALNRDMPYDRFIRWQLAGDELAPEDNLALKATGFLAAGVHSTQITKNEVELHRYNEMDDMLSTLGTAMLGLSIGCARCHDHKYDPIPQGDYYRMLSTFTTTVRSEVDLDVDPEGYQKAKAAFDREHAPLVAARKTFETDELPSRLAAWEQSRSADAKSPYWIILEPASEKSEAGAALAALDDFSILAVGENSKHDTYTIIVDTKRSGITAVRLEALSHASFAGGGPGRAANGNFALSDFRLTAAPAEGESEAVEIKLQAARATFEQSELPIAAAIDDDDKSAWAIDPQFGKDHTAVFEAAAPFGYEGGTKLTFTLRFAGNGQHNLGRFRLAITSAKPPFALEDASGLPEPILAILDTPADGRSTDQQSALESWYRTTDPDWQRLNTPVEQHLAAEPKPTLVKAMIASEGLPPIKLHSQGDEFFKVTHYLRRGNPNQKLEPAEQGFLQVLTSAPQGAAHWQVEPPEGWRTSYRRAAMAHWMTDVDRGAGGLLARVMVNRLWQHHLGRGIVATPSDFGARGEPPTHPELLNWLADELVDGGWRLKPIHKLIMTSAVYMQSAALDEIKARADPTNHLLWRVPRRRLEAEVIRDAILAVGGGMDCTMFGPGTLDNNHVRRSIYFTVKRSKLAPMMQVFDCPDALSGMPERPTTTIAPQALLLLNNSQVRRWAEGFAARIVPTSGMPLDESILKGYEIALGHDPSDADLSDSRAFIIQQTKGYAEAGKSDAREQAMADFCQVLFCLNEFVYVD